MVAKSREFVAGRNPVWEVLQAERRSIHALLVAKGLARSENLARLLSLAETKQIPIQYVSRSTLDQKASHHQGVAIEAGPYPYSTLDQIYQRIRVSQQAGLVLLLDTLQDPQNLGSLLRTAEAFGVHGVILPPRRSAKITPAVVRASAGATEHLLVAQSNLAQVIRDCKTWGMWIVGIENDAQAQVLGSVDLSGPIALVVGSEGFGLRRLVRDSCDFLLRIPMHGRVDSLNAAVAGSIALYAINKARPLEVSPDEEQ